VRHLRVLYALPTDDATNTYLKAKDNFVMEGHEFVCPQNKLGQSTGPLMREFLRGMAPDRHFAV
jgi:hypothetical protein